MSRTYRTHLDTRIVAYGRLWTFKEHDAYIKSLRNPGEPWYVAYAKCRGWAYTRIVDRRARDQKPWNKPPKWFKRQERQKERSKIRDAIRNHRLVPFFKKTDQWNWT